MRLRLPSVPLAREMAPVSPLFFGAASVGGRVAPSVARRAMSLALELGVTGIDVARSYGHGEAERIIGVALGSQRDRVILCTKAGIDPAPFSSLRRRIAPIASSLLAPAARLRARVASRAVPSARARPFDPVHLTSSLETSLSALRTDRVDIFLAHRCPSSVSEYEAFAELAESFVARGLTRFWGICGSLARVREVSAHARPPVVQLPACDVLNLEDDLEEDPATLLTMWYAPFGGRDGFAQRLAMAPRDLTRRQRERWVTEVCLRIPLARPTNTVGTVVCSMSSASHVESNVKAVLEPRLSFRSLKQVERRLRRGST